MTEEKRQKNMHINNSSEMPKNSTNKNKKNKKKYMYYNNSYYYYKNKKKKKQNKLDETTTIEVVDVFDDKNNKDIEDKKNESLKNIDKKDIEKVKNKVKTKQKEQIDKNLIITKELDFSYEKPAYFNTKDKIEELQQAIDMYYYEEELGKFSIKDEKKHLKELPAITEEELQEAPAKKIEKSVKLNPLDNIDMIVKFKSEPLPGTTEEDTDSGNEKKDDLIITREIDFSYDAKDLKKKKVLNELKSAIEDFDRIEMLSEIESSVDSINDIEELEKAEEDLINLKPMKKTKERKNKKETKKEEKVPLKELDFSDDEQIEQIEQIDNEPKELDNSDVDKDKLLDTKLQPLVEEDKFTQILNKIDLEEKLKEIANSEENSNYLAETFLTLKNKNNQKIQYEIINRRKIYWILGSLLLFVILIFLIIDYMNENNKEFISASYSSSNLINVDRDTLFLNCMNRNFQVTDKNEEIVKKEQEITEYIKNTYDASVIYQDIKTGYSFGYNSAEVYYAASTIKLLDALYVYTKASTGEINLDATITYTENYSSGSNMGLKDRNYGEEITIRDLVKYAVTVSDNSAHQMLVSYIGKSKLKDFGNELGATNTMIGNDNFGSISGIDAIIYLNAANDFINTKSDLAEEFKNILISADQAYLNLSDEIVSAHKYGNYEKYYHNIGIVYDKNPYMIAILSNEGYRGDFEDMIRDINKRIYELHNLYYEYRDTMCYSEVYMD